LINKNLNKYIAVLGDLHGHITLAYRILKRWETENNKILSAIFQVGDFGTFPPPFKVDKATMRFYEKDPDELSFIDYYEGSKEADEILKENYSAKRYIKANLYFIKGNHEDFDFLESLPEYYDSATSLDAYHKIFYLKSGNFYKIPIDGINLNIACLGGVNYHKGFGAGPASPYYTKSEFKQLCSIKNNIDIFLSHDVPYGTIHEGSGSLEVLEFIKDFQPALHFCGHYHEDGMELVVPGKTKSFQLNEVNFRKPSKLNKGCIAIIEITENKTYSVYILDEDWMKEYNSSNFREI
jgi:predicted phosphodiesterase